MGVQRVAMAWQMKTYHAEIKFSDGYHRLLGWITYHADEHHLRASNPLTSLNIVMLVRSWGGP